MPHEAVKRLVLAPNYVRLDATSRLLQLAPLSFDAATFEIWGALLNGGTLVIMPPGPVSIEEIGVVLVRQQVDTVWLTAGLFNQMVDNALPALSGLRQMLAGGEVLSVRHVDTFRRAYPQCQLINGYGPTENTTFSCCYRIPVEADLSGGVPIGSPVNNTRAYLLDGNLAPAPVGVAGELYVAGAGKGRASSPARRFLSSTAISESMPSSKKPLWAGDGLRFSESQDGGHLTLKISASSRSRSPAGACWSCSRRPELDEATTCAGVGSPPVEWAAGCSRSKNGRRPLSSKTSRKRQIRVPVDVFRNSDRNVPGTWVRPRKGRAPYWDTERLAQEIETQPHRELARLRCGP